MALTTVFWRDQCGDGCAMVFEGVNITFVCLMTLNTTDIIVAMGGVFPLQIQAGVFLLMTGTTLLRREE